MQSQPIGMRIEITSTSRNATEQISEKYKSNPIEHKFNIQYVFYRGGDSLQGAIGGGGRK